MTGSHQPSLAFLKLDFNFVCFISFALRETGFLLFISIGYPVLKDAKIERYSFITFVVFILLRKKVSIILVLE